MCYRVRALRTITDKNNNNNNYIEISTYILFFCIWLLRVSYVVVTKPSRLGRRKMKYDNENSSSRYYGVKTKRKKMYIRQQYVKK